MREEPKGHIEERKDRPGSYRVHAYAGRDDRGKKQYLRATVRGSRQDAERALARLLNNGRLGGERGAGRRRDGRRDRRVDRDWSRAVAPPQGPQTREHGGGSQVGPVSNGSPHSSDDGRYTHCEAKDVTGTTYPPSPTLIAHAPQHDSSKRLAGLNNRRCGHPPRGPSLCEPRSLPVCPFTRIDRHLEGSSLSLGLVSLVRAMRFPRCGRRGFGRLGRELSFGMTGGTADTCEGRRGLRDCATDNEDDATARAGTTTAKRSRGE
jgi:hypothetical protein